MPEGGLRTRHLIAVPGGAPRVAARAVAGSLGDASATPLPPRMRTLRYGGLAATSIDCHLPASGQPVEVVHRRVRGGQGGPWLFKVTTGGGPA